MLFDKVWTFQVPGHFGTYSSIIQHIPGGPGRVRFDPLVMTCSGATPEEAMDCIGSAKREAEIVLRTGDWLVIDNWRCMHGRGGVSKEGQSRSLLRYYWG